jgi:DHA2 family integral membrane protein (MFS transporter)
MKNIKESHKNMNKNTSSTLDPKRWMILYSAIIAVLAVVIDGAMMGLIAPSVAKDLQADPATIGLISSISALMLAAFVLGGGTLGDIYGRKRFLSYGILGMIFTSILSMLAPSAGLLIPIRALAGIMAALVNPLALAIITVTFDAEERPKAFGIFGAAIGVVAGVGTIIISFLNQQFGWRAAFWLVILLAAVAYLMVRHFVHESKSSEAKRVDWTGIFLAAGGLFGIVYGINQAGTNGFLSSGVLLPLGIGAVALTILIIYSSRAKDPALQLSLFKNKTFGIGVLLALLIGFSSMGAFFQLSNYLQSLQRVSAIQSALTLLPFTLSVFVFAIIAGRLVGRYSNHILIGSGVVAMTLGLVLMAFWLSPTAGFIAFLFPLILLGGGNSLANTPRLNALLASVPLEQAGAASAINNASVQLGNALGIAVLGALFQSFARKNYFADLTKAGLEDTQIQKSVEVLTTWLQSNSGDISTQFGITVQQLEGVINNYEIAYTGGVVSVLFIAAGVVALGMVAIFRMPQDK